MQNGGGGAYIWCSTAGGAQVALIQQLQQLLLRRPTYIYQTEEKIQDTPQYFTKTKVYCLSCRWANLAIDIRVYIKVLSLSLSFALSLSTSPLPHPVSVDFLTISLPLLAFISRIHRSGQVPHLDAAVAVAGEQIASRTRPHTTRTLTLSHHEARDGGPVHWLHFTDPDKTGAHTHTKSDVTMQRASKHKHHSQEEEIHWDAAA